MVVTWWIAASLSSVNSKGSDGGYFISQVHFRHLFSESKAAQIYLLQIC